MPAPGFFFNGMILLLGARWDRGDSRAGARHLLSLGVLEAWGWEFLPTMERGEKGKLFFPDFPNRHFNLSHSGPYALCALSDLGPVGIDVELVRSHNIRLPRYVMSEEELVAFDGSWEKFAEIWVLKEAYVKLLGRSIWPPREVPAPPPVPYRTYTGSGWRAALCGEGELPETIDWRRV